MAFDGDFSLGSSLEWFLERCPQLHGWFESSLKQGGEDDEVLKALAEVFLMQFYTIPLMGCFRPAARRVVDRAVSLLRFIPTLRWNSNSDDTVSVEGLGIDAYSRAGKGLDLHEVACLAFCRALDLCPSLLGSVIGYFEFAPPPFQRILTGLATSAGGGHMELMNEKDTTSLLRAVRTSYRFLLLAPDTFSKLWDWSCFLNLVKQSANSTESRDILWCSVKVVSIVLKLGDRGAEKSGITKEDALSCFLRWEKFCQDVSVEKAGWYIGSSRSNMSGSYGWSSDCDHKRSSHSSGFDLSSTQVHLEPPVRCQRLAWDNSASGNLFVLTSAVEKSFEAVILAVNQKWPVLLYGPSGGGKSLLISKLAEDYGRQVVSIPMDDQIDGKTLLGSYVSTEKPGEFRWQPGSLTQAVLNGYWVVFEDIDKAPSDVHSILLPLLEGTRSFVTGHGEEIRVAESFQLFATITTSKLEISSSIKGGISLSVFWRRVMVGSPSVEDLKNIVRASYPSLEPIADKLVETFDHVKAVQFEQLAGFHPGNDRFSVRDLLKWCKRVAGLGVSFVGNSLSADECYCIYQEAVDIFAAFSTSVDNRLTIRKFIAKLWMVPPTTAETLYPANKPIIQDSLSETRIGRVSLARSQPTLHAKRKSFVDIRSSLHLLEKLAASVKYNEAVLMVGETGTGKTTLVQDLALRLGQKLTVLNLSQQSDVADLLGGFKPMNAQFICFPLYKEFEDLFSKTVSVKENYEFLSRLQKYLADKKWKALLNAFQKGVNLARKLGEKGLIKWAKKRKKPLEEEKLKSWERFAVKLETARGQIDASSGIVFSFVEGAFVKALKDGEWILLDEVNLAPPETLQRVIGVLEGDTGSLCLTERGDISCIRRHPNFRLFACMNPATDAGKRDLPFSLRSRFAEYFVDDVLDDDDLSLFVNQSLGDSRSDPDLVNKIVSFYKASKRDAEERLQDGANQKPQYSLRSLHRALKYIGKAEEERFGLQKAIYDGFSMFFQTLLDKPSATIMNQMILSKLLGGKTPGHVPFDRYLRPKDGETDSSSDEFVEKYILTKSVKENLRNVARAILIQKYPVLLQGPTSSGKTSLVRYLAAIAGRKFVRINNHEHTDLQEYLGTYVTDASGKLVFHEGVLVRAVKYGYWIVLDELNLAPSDVLEALNRLLDDNRELFVPELQETIRPHENFMLFATQNPPTIYGGRKMLSRAFRNRFVEIHVDDIPEDELSTIIERRCKIPGSYAKKMIEVMKQLQINRQRSKVFAGKHGYITPRDLFRWADRFRKFEGTSYNDLARDGYYLLAEKLREDSEKSVILEVLNKHLPGKLDQNDLYTEESVGVPFQNIPNEAGLVNGPQRVIWTPSMRRLYFLVQRCYKVQEPVILVGETGGGKTTVCQLLSDGLELNLRILNCHQYTETSDFLGGFYPIRERSKLMSEYKKLIDELVETDAFKRFEQEPAISSDIGQASSALTVLRDMIDKYKQGLSSNVDISDQHTNSITSLEVVTRNIFELHQKWQTIFKWQDGPLVNAMRDGDLFLVDEISLADDSVLERLNSVLEPERTLSLAEKGGSNLEKIVAKAEFLLLATMNPGGDFGKKELSPALRNRFTEIWVPSVCDSNELRSIALRRLSSSRLICIADPMLSFWEWFSHLQTGKLLTVRDLLSWVDFINVTESRLGAEYACLHGLFLILLDGLNLGSGMSKNDAGELRNRCLSFLLEQMKVDRANSEFPKLSTMQNYGWPDLNTTRDTSSHADVKCGNMFGIDPFYIHIGTGPKEGKFEFSAPTTRRNALRVLRAMQLPKPVLLEGSPGVGKTSLIVALGESSGHRVVRINLSEQTDIMDLLGSDLPVESEDGMKFAWSDGILLQALKEGCWVLLDELNLAPQSVLEGLNAILDHRAEVFIPELGRTFKCPSSFRIFACQNPTYQGGGRKGLPKSFLNRFTKVYVDELVQEDYELICRSCFPTISEHLLQKLILFNKRLYEETMLYHKFAQEGSPWEFNLRDVLRSCEIIAGTPEKSKEYCFLNVVYVQRMRTEADRRQVLHLYEEIFKVKPYINPYPRVELNSEFVIVGNASIKRNSVQSSRISNNSLKILPGIRQSLEAAAHCISHQWLCILVGQASSGKTSLIRLLAELTGNVLNELHLSSGTDISEILGCFEQYNAIRNFLSVVAEVECYVDEYNNSELGRSMEEFEIDDAFVTKWFAFLASINHDFLSCFTSSSVEDRKRFVTSLEQLLEIMQQLKSGLDENARSSRDLDKATKIIFKLLEGHQKRSFSAKFEWVSGLLIKAIERGEWIVLENANCCNPTVLDRINSLVEPSGSITVNECGIVDGKPVVLHPHPNFRMFLTVNPSYGEVSRAMRNRGVEIFVRQPSWLLEEPSVLSGDEFELKDVNRFLVLSGIPIDSLVQSMSKAHVYARKEGARLNISITYLELTRWVQLFQQLIMNGNKPIWSLKTSWEHIYISSFGEADGGCTVSHAKDAFLSATELSESCISLGSSLCLPGGWPMPLKLKDWVLYSRECTVKQNCMYVDFLVAQCASYKLKERGWRMYTNSTANSEPSLMDVDTTNSCIEPSLMDVNMLRQSMFPCSNSAMIPNSRGGLDFKLCEKKLLFAADWAIEQAPENDLRLYLQWFCKLGSQSQILSQFSNLLEEQVMKHPVWLYMTDRYRELTSLSEDVNSLNRPIPMLSTEIVDEVAPSYDNKIFLCNAIKSVVGPLICTVKQWNYEEKHLENEEVQPFRSMLGSLRMLEEDFLRKLVELVESLDFDQHIQTYENFLEDHILFWNCVEKNSTNSKKLKTEDFGPLLVSWRSMLKNAAKLKDICPRAVRQLLEDSKNLEKISRWRIHSEKSLLWDYGGRPALPSSADLFYKQLQLLKFCDLLWPTKSTSVQHKLEKAKSENPVGDCVIEIVATSNAGLRTLVVEGISKLPIIMTKLALDENEVHAVQQLDEIYENLKKCFEHAKQKCEKNLGHIKLEVFDGNSSAFCLYPTEILCRKFGFDSWQETLPLTDITSFYLDMELLQDLSSALVVDSENLKERLSIISQNLKYALDFSLGFSSRPPQLFSPHQKLLWIHDMWTLVNEVKEKVASFVLEMWFRWHQSLWIYCPVSAKGMVECSGHDNDSKSRIDFYDILVPDVLVHPVMTSTVLQILTTNNTTVIKNCSESPLKLKVASCSLWHSLSPGSDLHGFLSSALQCLFQQIIIAHRRAFDADRFEHIKKILPNLWTNKTFREKFKKEIQDSSHQGLKMSFDTYISPLLRELCGERSFTDCISNVGRAWLYLGGLRLNLLLCCDDLDPAVKYHCKYLQLNEKISSLKLEIQVRQECNYLAGRLSTRIDDAKQVQELERLELKKRKIERKVVFRSNYEKFQRLKSECEEFLTRVKSSKFLWSSSLEAMSSEQISNEVSNWQSTATAFIEKLSDTYTEYVDLVQPVQIAVYEMKLGFSLVVSSLMQKRALNMLSKESRVDSYTMDVVTESIYTLMKFPLASPSKIKSIKLNSVLPEISPYEVAGDMSTKDIDLLENLIIFSGDVMVDQSVSSSQLKAYLKQNILSRTTHSVCNARMMDSSSFKILDKVFLEFSDSWSKMKTRVKTREDSDSQQYKFRPRAFRIDSIIELDISTLENSSANEIFLEWKELVSEDEHAAREDVPKEQDNSEEEWNLVDESVLNRVVHMHDELFRLNSFVTTGSLQISDDDRFHCFIDSYTVGTKIIRGFKSTLLSSLDARLAPENLLRLCLEHDQKFASSQKSARRYNFYKDSNALEMNKLAKILSPLEQHIRSQIDEWENDHALHKILNVIDVLLNIPLTTPLAKVLSGLQFLVMNIQTQQENGSKLRHSDQLESLLVLVVSWQKMEFESWPVLLDEVQHQYDINAAKLWFPLYPIILKESQSGMSNNIESLKDFIETSSIGEFRRRLQLLSAFHGQVYIIQRLNCDQSLYEMETLKALYNIIGFYVQSLPGLLEHIQQSRKEIEKELKKLLKLCSWDHKESFLSIENAKRTRQKFRKLIQKYNDLLQQNAMLFLNQDAELQKTRLQPEHGQKFLSDLTERHSGISNATSDLQLCVDEDRFEWYADWKDKAEGALKSSKLNVAFEGECLAMPCVSYKDGWNDLWLGLKDIFGKVVDYGVIWKEEHKSQKKKWALSEFLNMLKSSGLSKHTTVHIKDRDKSWWFLQPLHELQDVLPDRLTGSADFLGKSESPPHKKLSTEWNMVTGSYFKSVASMLVLQQICPHKDIGCEQVDRIGSFIQQLIEIQQKQHATASTFAKDLKSFKDHVSTVRSLYSNYSSSDNGIHTLSGTVPNQDAIFKCMWQQKQLFDTLCSISRDELLLLRTFNQTHSETCETVKAASHGFLTSIEKFFLVLKNAKESLDNYLLGRDRVITNVVSPHLFIVSNEMEELVCQNFNIIEDFKMHLLILNKENADRSSVKYTLLSHFDEVFAKEDLVKTEFYSSTQGKIASDERTSNKTPSELDELIQSLNSTFEHIKQAVQKLCSPCNDERLPTLQGKITSWSILFESLLENLSLKYLRDKLLRVIASAKKRLSNVGGENVCIAVLSGDLFKNLPVSLDMFVNFGDRLLQEHFDMHKTVSMMIRLLADVLASLYSKGFGTAEDQGTDDTSDSHQDASGTGMGEGVGKTDVSDQITDEDQLLGASNKLDEEQDASGEVPNKNDKGIEMEQDFQAEAFDVSEDSEEDNMDEDGDDEQLESAMGDTGDNSEVVNEKLWDKDDKDEDENPNNASEKYESGPSVKDTDQSSRELRAKDDSAVTADEHEEFNSQEGDESDDEKGKQDDIGDDREEVEDAKLDKEEAFAERTGLKPEDVEQDLNEDMDLDKEDSGDSVEDDDPQGQEESVDREIPGEEKAGQNDENDETMEEAETGQQDLTTERDESSGDPEQNAETNMAGSSREVFGLGVSNSLGDVPNSISFAEPHGDLQESNTSNMAPDSNLSNSNDIHSGLAPLRGLPSSKASDQDTMVSESANSGKNASDQSQSHLPESSAVQKNQPNPNRSIGDPLKEWKERVKVFLDLEMDDTVAQGDLQDENADEFGYVSEFEKGTSQALGVATSEQVDGNVDGNKKSKDEPNADRDDVMDMDIERESSETQPLKNGPSLPKSRSEDKTPAPELEETRREESQEIRGQEDEDITGLSDGLVTLRKTYYSEGVKQLSKLSMNDINLGKARDQGETSVDSVDNSMALWRKYELLTTRLSQELAEQLRLVMEPTLASKLQGDYKTGKRINMKKVIPYIASHFRRDKIWLRRTRPNKRDYQVIIAVDDSRSMSESGCGNVAIEALVAVCRAMSQLEMGNLAVANFGTKGNIRLLHDFDHPFTGEAGVKMISSFTFKQENTIADNPVVDLLKYLNNKLDTAVAKARLPSGQNPLEQLVLIIADGRFHEKENLKRCVRDFLSRKRMVAFLLLDSPQESIVDLVEASIEGTNVKFSKYMDSFPFPFYIVLRNIEALPRTLADLLRQWFELIQNTRE